MQHQHHSIKSFFFGEILASCYFPNTAFLCITVCAHNTNKKHWISNIFLHQDLKLLLSILPKTLKLCYKATTDLYVLNQNNLN